MNTNLPKKISDAIDKQSLKYLENLELRSLVQIIPYVGGSLDTILSAEGNRIQKERFEKFLNELKEGMNKLNEQKIDKNFIKSEEFFSLFQITIEKVIRNYEKEKIQYFRNIFVNSVKIGKSDTYYKEGFMNILANLSAVHISILKDYFEREEVFKKENRGKGGWIISAESIAQKFDLTDSQVEGFCNDLLRYGFLYDALIGIYGYKRGHFRTTKYSNDFIGFITLEEDND